MDLNTLRETIIQTSDDDWHQLNIGPFYHDRIWVADDLPFTGDSHSHDARAVLMDDVSVSIEWGLLRDNRSSRQDNEYHLWMEDASFPDPVVTTYWVDVFYNGDLVDRQAIIRVDGGRAYLPNYDLHRTDGGDTFDLDGATYEFTTDRWRYYLAQVINQLSGNGDWENYVKRASIRLV